jgi:hypothetical protein
VEHVTVYTTDPSITQRRNADYVPWSKLLAKAIDKAESVAELEALLTDNPPHIAADDEIYPAAGAGIQRRSRSDLA